jgi:hypothetical protein
MFSQEKNLKVCRPPIWGLFLGNHFFLINKCKGEKFSPSHNQIKLLKTQNYENLLSNNHHNFKFNTKYENRGF